MRGRRLWELVGHCRPGLGEEEESNEARKLRDVSKRRSAMPCQMPSVIQTLLRSSFCSNLLLARVTGKLHYAGPFCKTIPIATSSSRRKVGRLIFQLWHVMFLLSSSHWHRRARTEFARSEIGTMESVHRPHSWTTCTWNVMQEQGNRARSMAFHTENNSNDLSIIGEGHMPMTRLSW
jgi:hypothetical protein